MLQILLVLLAQHCHSTGKAEKKDKNLVLVSQCPVGLSNTHTHKNLEGQPNSLCDSIISFSSSKDDPILLLISPKLVFKSFKSIVLSFFPLLLLKQQSRNPSSCSWHLVTITYGRMLWWQGRITALRNIGVTSPQHDYIINLIFPLGCSSKHCDCIMTKGFLYLGEGLDVISTWHEAKL